MFILTYAAMSMLFGLGSNGFKEYFRLLIQIWMINLVEIKNFYEKKKNDIYN
jgi:hypothetical protein